MLKNIIYNIKLVCLILLSLQIGCKEADQPQQNKDLLEAVRSGNTTAITQLLKEGADVNTKGIHNVTPLHLASIHGDCNAIKLLIKNGAKLTAKNGSNKTPLYYAAMNGHLEAAKLLIEKGANVNAKNTMGESAIYPAAESGNLELVKFLVSKGAKIPTTGYTPLHATVRSLHISQKFEDKCKSMVEYFLSQGVDINAKGDTIRSPAD